ncbi:MAG: pentapeptide repeat-containing protein [Cyanobacteria bacterium P01_H01_bin.105]
MNIQPEQPTSIWKRPVKVKFGALAKALGKGTIAGAFGNWPGVAGSGIEIVSALGLKANNPSATVWIWIQRSLLQAMSELTAGVKGKLSTKEPNFKRLCEQLDLVLERSEFSISQEFSRHPKSSQVVQDMKVPFRRWLRMQGLSELQANSLAERLPGYFVLALSQQLQTNPDDYVSLESTPLEHFRIRKASEQEFAWHRYSASLQQKVDEEMFAEAFSLRQVYMPLRAYYEREVKGKDDGLGYANPQYVSKTERVVVDLQDAITNWLKKSDRTDAIRVICGGPGCGKSSFGRMLAAELSENKTFPVLFVPLHQFRLSDDLVDSMDEFLKNDLNNILPPNPLTRDNAERQLLIIFDGLDELSMQGKVASQVAQDFVREVQNKLLGFNGSEAKVRALISGRDVAIQANQPKFPKEGQILHVLPYYLLDKSKYADEAKLLAKDYRQDWWKTYGTLKGKPYEGLPKELDKGKLIEITAQPLLNYLVALSYDQGDINFSEESNLNVVYNDLLEQVYQRDWAGYQHPTLGNVAEKDFIRILEEIAVACWHENSRTTPISNIEERCTNVKLKSILEFFEKDAKEGVTQLLIAFYFRQSGLQGSEKTFEFTHKSFGEYLTVRRLVRELGLIQDELTRHQENPDIGWDEKECLKRWTILCGPAELDKYLLNFLRDEIKRSDKETAGQWQKTLCDLIGYMLKHGMPMETLDPRPKFIEEIRMYRNASTTLLAMLSSCARVTGEISDIKWPNSKSFGEWLTVLQGQKIGGNNPITFNCLDYLNLRGCYLIFKDLYRTNLSGAVLNEAKLDGAVLNEAKLDGAVLNEARLIATRFHEARLSGARLDGAILNMASFSAANLNEANLNGANLNGANLNGADLSGADLEDVQWNEETSWKDVKGIDTAKNIPQELRQHLIDLGILSEGEG